MFDSSTKYCCESDLDQSRVSKTNVYTSVVKISSTEIAPLATFTLKVSLIFSIKGLYKELEPSDLPYSCNLSCYTQLLTWPTATVICTCISLCPVLYIPHFLSKEHCVLTLQQLFIFSHYSQCIMSGKIKENSTFQPKVYQEFMTKVYMWVIQI